METSKYLDCIFPILFEILKECFLIKYYYPQLFFLSLLIVNGLLNAVIF